MWTVKWCAGKSCELCIQRRITWKEQADGWTDSVGDVEQNRITVFNAPGQNTESLTETIRAGDQGIGKMCIWKADANIKYCLY